MNRSNIACFLVLVTALASGCVTKDESVVQCDAMADAIVEKASECGFSVDRPRCALTSAMPAPDFDWCMQHAAGVVCGAIADQGALFAVTQMCMSGRLTLASPAP